MITLQSSIREWVTEEDILSWELDLSENSELVENLLLDPFKKIIGQEKTKSIFKDIFEWIISEINIRKEDYQKPIRSMMFSWPSGVGKTLFARNLQYILNEHYRNNLEMIKINCADYSWDTSYSLNRLNGASAWFVGSNKKPSLHPDLVHWGVRVILLDEIEKSWPALWNLFLAILDDGVLDIDYTDTGTHQKNIIMGDPDELSDVSSVQTFFKDTIVIMTSNLWNTELEEALLWSKMWFSSNTPKKIDEINIENIVMQAIEKRFSIEMQGRINDVIPFEHLTEDNGKDIIDLVINQLILNTLSQKEWFMLEFSNSAKEKIIQDIISTDDFRKFWGRAIESYFEKNIIPYLSRAKNSWKLSQDSDNPSCLLVTERDDKIVFSKIPVRNVNRTSEKVGVIITDI